MRRLILLLLLALVLPLSAVTTRGIADSATADGEWSWPSLRAGNAYAFTLSGTFGGGTATLGYIDASGSFASFGRSLTAAGTYTAVLPSTDAAGHGTPAISISGATSPSILLTTTKADAAAVDVTNTAVAAAIAENPEAVRSAADITGDAERVWTLDIEAQRYKTKTGIGLAAAERLSSFLKGLDVIGVRDNFADGYLMRSDSQAASGSTLYSLRLANNLAITGSPERHRNGMLWGNDDPSSPTSAAYSSGNFGPLTGEWTVFAVDVRDKQASTSGQRRSFQGWNTSTTNWILMQNGTNYSSYTSLSGSVAQFVSSPVKYAADPRHLIHILRNDDPSGATSLATSVNGSAFSTTTGNGNIPFQKVFIGCGSTTGTTPVNYSDAMTSLLLVFDAALTDAQCFKIRNLIESSILPKVRFLLEGDSMAYTSIGLGYWMSNESGFFGLPMEHLNVATGGESSTTIAGQIGTSGGINNQADDGVPTFCLIHAGNNDPGVGVADTADGTESHANLRTLWAAAKARGMTVIACTIPGSTAMDGVDWDLTSPGTGCHDERAIANGLIRADAGIYYDYLLDVDQLLTAEYGATYWQDTDCFYDGTHYGTSPTGSGPFMIGKLWDLVGDAMP